MGSFIQELENILKKKPAKEGITITISGPAASGKSTVAEKLAKKLCLEHISMGKIFRKLAAEENTSLEEYLRKSTANIHNKADLEQLYYCIRGNIVLDGRLGGWVAGKYADIKIWLTAPLNVRAERYCKRHNVSMDIAEKKVRERDKTDIDKYKAIYNIDFRRLDIYDFVINNQYFDIEGTYQVIYYIIKKALKL